MTKERKNESKAHITFERIYLLFLPLLLLLLPKGNGDATLHLRRKLCFKINSRQPNRVRHRLRPAPTLLPLLVWHSLTCLPLCPPLPLLCPVALAIQSLLLLLLLPFAHGECALNERLIGSVFTRCQGRWAGGWWVADGSWQVLLLLGMWWFALGHSAVMPRATGALLRCGRLVQLDWISCGNFLIAFNCCRCCCCWSV